MLLRKNIGLCGLVLFVLTMAMPSSSVDAQSKRRKTVTAKKPVATAAAPAPTAAVEEAPAKSDPKKNERPAAGNNSAPVDNRSAAEPTHFYEFAQPEFYISKIVIEHDDTGRGTITFTKKLFGEIVSDPLQISPSALERIDAAYAALNFLDSNENYQYEKDYSHLGVATFRLKRGSKQRTTVFNYTVNKDAKALADEYRKVGNQFIWIFDITLARENQPLESPKLLDSLDSLIRRNEISDPDQLVALLKSLTDDERIPLIARNHATRLVERIGKSGKR